MITIPICNFVEVWGVSAGVSTRAFPRTMRARIKLSIDLIEKVSCRCDRCLLSQRVSLDSSSIVPGFVLRLRPLSSVVRRFTLFQLLEEKLRLGSVLAALHPVMQPMCGWKAQLSFWHREQKLRVAVAVRTCALLDSR